MQIDEKKLARQEKGIDKWFDQNCKGILDYATGVGKTFTAHLGIKRLEKIKKHTYVVTVPSEPLEKQWREGLTKSFPKHLNERILVMTAKSYEDSDVTYECDVHIIDEIHEFHTELRQNIINGNLVKSKYVLGLTASGDDKNFRNITKFLKVIDYISNEEAIEKGFVAPFIEYNIGLGLTKVEKDTYDKCTTTISKYMPMFNKDIRLAQKVLVGGKDSNTNRFYAGAGWAVGIAYKHGWNHKLDLTNPIHRELDNLWNPSKIIGYANSLMNAVRGRKAVLCNAQSKINTTLALVKKFNKVKTIIFSESTKFADKVNIVLNDANQPCVVYHSSLKSKVLPSPKTNKFITYGKVRLKREALESIKSGKARILSTAKSLDRGLDIPDIRFGLTTSGTQNPTQYKQRRGRTTRKEASVFDEVPVLLINLYIVDTQDEIWLKNRQAKSSHVPIVVNTINDITYYPPPNVEFTINDI